MATVIGGASVRAAAGLPGDWTGLVVLCAANPWDGMRLADQPVAEHLARLAPVLYVDPPMSLLTPLRRPTRAAALREPRLRLLGPSLARLTPVVLPGMERPGMSLVTAVLAGRALRRAVAALGGSVRAVIATSAIVPLLGACRAPLAVHWLQDDYVSGARLLGRGARRVARGEARVAARADCVVTASQLLADRWRARGHRTVLIPNGCDDAVLAAVDSAPLPGDVDLPAPIAGFVGHLGERIDLRLLEAVAIRGHSLLLVGPRHPRFDAARLRHLLSFPNVRWVGPKPAAALPSYLRVMDVGLVPYGDTAFNRGSFPLKTLEYLAAGRGVVATDLPAVRWLGTDLIRARAGAGPFAEAVAEALAEPRTPALVERRRAFAAEHGWSRRAVDFARTIGIDLREPSRA
jgi:teichuronic acid biosynthesis glycosyltransferase TuaH